jgi:hypothetical protein
MSTKLNLVVLRANVIKSLFEKIIFFKKYINSMHYKQHVLNNKDRLFTVKKQIIIK